MLGVAFYGSQAVKCYVIVTKRHFATHTVVAFYRSRWNATTNGILLPKNGILLPKNGILLPQKISRYRSKIPVRNRKYFDYFFKNLFFDSLSNEIK